MKFRTGYEDDVVRESFSAEEGLTCPESDMRVKQEFAEESDINTIVRRFGLTGQLPQDVRVPMYGDFTAAKDYRDSLHALMAAEESFMAMPADVRRRFDNDPAAFVDFCSDKANLEEMRKLGLAVEKIGEPVPAARAAGDAPGST